uniref:Uncharacterized protein n=2 Tax=Salix viminalis TaxID=40686 RepID=A0A6N2LPS0_SALVM
MGLQYQQEHPNTPFFGLINSTDLFLLSIFLFLFHSANHIHLFLCCLLGSSFWAHMGNNRQVGASSFDHLFGPKDSSSSSSTSSGIFGSIFPPPSKVPAGRDSGITGNHAGNEKYVNPDNATPKSQGREQRHKVAKARVQFIRMKRQNHVTLVRRSTMVAKKTTPQGPRTQNLNMFSRKIMKRMIRMATIQTALQEGTGGRVHCIIRRI